MAKTDISNYPKGTSAHPATLDLGKAGKCNPVGIKDSRPEDKDRVQSAK